MSDETVVGWVTIGEARTMWPDGKPMSEARLSALLTASFEMCEAHAPALPVIIPPTPTPQRYKEAQVTAARGIWTSYRANGAGQIGLDGEPVYSTDAPTLNAQIRQMLRPGSGLPSVG